MRIKEGSMIRGIVIFLLLIESVMDIKNRTISVLHMVIFGIAGIIANCALEYQSLWTMLGGVLVGAIVLLFGLFSKGAIGIGDGIIFGCIGIYIGGFDNIRLLFYSLIVAAILGGGYVLLKRKSIKSQIPFVPCIFVAYLLMLGMEVLL